MPKRMGEFLAVVLCSLSIVGCMRREGRNADCKWPGEISGRSADARDLSADAEFAEDLAIRYADTHYGLRTPGYVSGEVYVAARERCMASLFEQVANEHGVPVGLVSGALGRNRTGIDLAINLPFLLLYCLAALAVAHWLWRSIGLRNTAGSPESRWPYSFLWRWRSGARCLERCGHGLQRVTGSAMAI